MVARGRPCDSLMRTVNVSVYKLGRTEQFTCARPIFLITSLRRAMARTKLLARLTGMRLSKNALRRPRGPNKKGKKVQQPKPKKEKKEKKKRKSREAQIREIIRN